MHDLSTRAKFPDACFQSPLLIMSKIVAVIQFVYRKIGGKCSELNFFYNDWSFGGDSSEIKHDWLLFVITRRSVEHGTRALPALG